MGVKRAERESLSIGPSGPRLRFAALGVVRVGLHCSVGLKCGALGGTVPRRVGVYFTPESGDFTRKMPKVLRKTQTKQTKGKRATILGYPLPQLASLV